MMVLRLNAPSSEELFTRIRDKVSQAPNFFRNAPVVLDLDGAGGMEKDIPALAAKLREFGLIVVGVQGGSRHLQERALAVGLPLVPAGRPLRTETPRTDAPRAEPGRPAPAPAPDLSAQRSTMVVSEPVRSGRQIYAPGGDLVVTAPVSAGAELLADGHIHVYGALRGRALAGLSGDASARIFCLSLEAEMVSVAGLYRVNEDIAPSIYKKPVQIYLKDGYLCLETF
jgi:septum site-determining protein MinC